MKSTPTQQSDSIPTSGRTTPAQSISSSALSFVDDSKSNSSIQKSALKPRKRKHVPTTTDDSFADSKEEDDDWMPNDISSVRSSRPKQRRKRISSPSSLLSQPTIQRLNSAASNVPLPESPESLWVQRFLFCHIFHRRVSFVFLLLIVTEKK